MNQDQTQKSSKISFPIRAKIMALLTGALAISLLSYLYVATSLFVADKVSYIYDYNLARIKAVAESVDGQIAKASVSASVAGHLLGSRDANTAVVDDVYQTLNAQYGVSALLYLRPVDMHRFAVAESHGSEAERLERLLPGIGWTPAEFISSEVLIGRSNHGAIPVGGRTVDSAGRPLAFLLLLEPKKTTLESPGKDFGIYLMDREGHVLSKGGSSLIDDQTLGSVFKAIPTGFDSGVREVTLGKIESIAGYQRLRSGALILLGLTPKEAAFTAQHALVRRSFALGLSVLLIALGITLVFVKNLTRRLREMWHATRKVSQGDFSVRVDTRGGTEDEVTSLAISFNSMSDKIDELMAQTAKKARMEKELETAQMVQGRFFPTSGFDHANLKLAGRFVPASECSGDWWQYATIGDQLLLVLGDVTGHGVSAALVTAGAHAAFTISVAAFKRAPETFQVGELLDRLHQAVLASAAGQATMTFAAAVIDLKSGKMVFANAAHPAPFLLRTGISQASATSSGAVKALVGTMNAALGERGPITFVTTSIQLQAGDRLFWYTDGVLEQRAKDKKAIRKTGLTRMLEELSGKVGFNAQSICEAFMSQTIAFFGDEERPDDITFITVVIPKGAQFERGIESEEPKVAAVA